MKQFPLIVLFIFLCFPMCAKNAGTKKSYPLRIECNDKLYPGIDCRDEDFQQFISDNMNMEFNPGLRAIPGSTGSAFALIVGIDDSNCSEFGPLAKAGKDADEMSLILKKSGYSVCLLNDKTGENKNYLTTKKNIIRWLKFFAKISNNSDRILFYYAGHGAPENMIYSKFSPDLEKEIASSKNKKEGEDFFLIPRQTSGNKLVIDSLVSYKEISEILSGSSSSETFVIIDACYANTVKNFVFRPVPYVSSSLKRQGYFFFCVWKDEARDGEFSPLIFEALKGNADDDKDNIVSMFEMINYVDKEWDNNLGLSGKYDNNVKHIIYSSGDMPIVCTD